MAQLLIDGSEPGVEGALRALAMAPLRVRAADTAQPQRSLEVLTEYNPERRTAVQIVPALIGVILFMTMVVFTAIALVRERERGNLELLITTPVQVRGADDWQARALRRRRAHPDDHRCW